MRGVKRVVKDKGGWSSNFACPKSRLNKSWMLEDVEAEDDSDDSDDWETDSDSDSDWTSDSDSDEEAFELLMSGGRSVARSGRFTVDERDKDEGYFEAELSLLPSGSTSNSSRVNMEDPRSIISALRFIRAQSRARGF